MERIVRAGIVGSRRRNTLHDRKIVFRLVEWLYQRAGSGLTIVSGGCPKGADAFAEEVADLHVPPIAKQIYPIDKEGIASRWEFTERAFARNRLVAQDSTELYPLVHSDRTGGTENTVGHALKLKVPVFLVNDQGEVYLSLDGDFPTCAPVVSLLDWSCTG